MLRCGPPDTASAPGGTSRRTTVPAPVAAPSPIVTGATNTLSRPGAAVPADDGAVLGDAVVVGGDRAGADVGALADLGVADVRQVRHLGARARSGRSWSRRTSRSCRRSARSRARPQVGERPDRRHRRRARAPEPWVRTTLRPGADARRRSACVSGSDRRARSTLVAPSSCTPGSRVTSGASSTPTSTHVVAGSTTVTPARIQPSSTRRFSSAPSRASCTRSLTPSVSHVSSTGTAPDAAAVGPRQPQHVGQVDLAGGVVACRPGCRAARS